MFRKALALATLGGAAVVAGGKPFTLILNGCIRVHVEVATCRQPKRGHVNWKVRPQLDIDFVVVGRMDPMTDTLLDYYLLPIETFAGHPIYLKASNFDRYGCFAYPSIHAVFGQERSDDAGAGIRSWAS